VVFNRLEKGPERLEPGELTLKGRHPALLTASGLSPAECGNQRRGAAEREPIIEAREKLRVRAINQFESRGNWKGNDSRCEAADYSVLLDLSGNAAVTWILRVWMKPRVKLRGGGEGEGAEPEQKHQSTCSSFAEVTCSLRFHPSLHRNLNAQNNQWSARSFLARVLNLGHRLGLGKTWLLSTNLTAVKFQLRRLLFGYK